MTDWISVKRRIPGPKDGTWVIVYNGKVRRMAKYTDGEWEAYEGFHHDPDQSEKIEGVTHWISVPAAPRIRAAYPPAGRAQSRRGPAPKAHRGSLKSTAA